MMRRLAFALIILISIPYFQIAFADGKGIYTYTYTVKETGWVDIITRFESNSSGSSWVLVPKFQKYSLRVVSGSIKNEKVIENTSYYFYSNYTFSYSPGTTIEINWSYRFGALIVEPNGAFFSTQIGFNRMDDALILVKLPKMYSIKGVEPSGYAIENGSDYNVVKYYLNGMRNNTLRVLISFETEKAEMKEMKVGKLTVVYPARYQDFAGNITKYYEKSLKMIQNITSLREEIPVKVNLFVPEKMEDITTQGYTGPRYTSDVITQGEVNLNMMLARMPEYELPLTLIHELLHQYMQAAGLGVELRWFHEGLAQYLSSVIVREMGMNPPEEPDNDTVRQIMAYTGGDFSFLLDWRGGGLPGDPSLYYSASLIIAKDLARKYGDDIYKKLFAEMRKDKATVNSPEDLLKYLNRAAGENVSDFFRSYGMIISESVQRSSLTRTAWSYVKQTSWFNPFAGIAAKILEDGSEDSATLAIYLTVLGVLTEALGLALIISTLLSIKKGVRRSSRVPQAEVESSTSQ
ncbi:hypothetical protein [Candidatus Korarchaeum cryptofilum]|nr:hypothetical protein [Candidatus Korarchaeum cryptofilum]